MNAIVEVLRPKKTKAPLEIQVEELKRQVRALKKQVKDERDHSVGMLAIMRQMTGGRLAELERSRRGACQCDECTCTPTRSQMLRPRTLL